jgi:4-amino-4-deoxy-L-arabinose transferase-like glycosyltransferase
MKRWLVGVLLGIILLVAAGLRLTGLDWDGYQHYHPDERYIVWVATTIERPLLWQTALDPSRSSFNPFYWPPDAASEGIVVLQDAPRDFAYGHVPLYLGVIATRLVEWVGPGLAAVLPPGWLWTQDVLNGRQAVEYEHLTAVARALTALVDVGTVLLIFGLGRRVYDVRVGLLGAAFLALNVQHIQLAHFFTVDPFLTFFVVAALLCMVAGGQTAVRRRQWGWLALAAVCVGMAIGSKFAAVLLLLPLTMAVLRVGGGRWVRWWVTAVGLVLLTFVLTNPFAVLDLSCEVVTPAGAMGPLPVPEINWRSCYLQNVVTQGAMVRGGEVPFTRQYLGTLPYLYFVEMQVRWGMGLLLGLAAFGGFGWAVWQGIRPLWRWLGRQRVSWLLWDDALTVWQSAGQNRYGAYMLLAWTVPFFVTTGGFQVKFMRYMQPLLPFLMLYAAVLLLAIRWRWGRWVAVTAVLLSSALYALAFVNLYSQPHPWLQGSRWVYENIPAGAVILSEQWDDALPSTLVEEGQLFKRSVYRQAELTWLTGAYGADSEEKLAQNLALLAQGDYLTVMSNRVYGVTPRLPDRYPLSSQYHPLLFDGALGYELVYVATRAPNLGGVHVVSDPFAAAGLPAPEGVAELWNGRTAVNLGRADESFTVYDQPLLMIFANTGRLSVEEMGEKFVRP